MGFMGLWMLVLTIAVAVVSAYVYMLIHDMELMIHNLGVLIEDHVKRNGGQQDEHAPPGPRP